MGKKDSTQGGKFELSRRDFVKVGAAAAAVGAVGVDWAVCAPRAYAVEPDDIFTSTCPYCSAQCGQKVAVYDGEVIDIYGDSNSPTSRGGLCSKGAGSYQLVTNPRRLGHPDHTAAIDPDGIDFTGTAWWRDGNDPWQAIPLDQAMDEIATELLAARALGGTPTPGLTAASNVRSVQFLGSSHINNEQNYLYRKLIANFGTSLTEHQARI